MRRPDPFPENTPVSRQTMGKWLGMLNDYTYYYSPPPVRALLWVLDRISEL